jgi:hypothetical protein
MGNLEAINPVSDAFTAAARSKCRLLGAETTEFFPYVNRFLIPAAARYFSLLRNVQTGSGAHPTPSSVGTGVLSRGKSGRGVKFTIHLRLVPRLTL